MSRRIIVTIVILLALAAAGWWWWHRPATGTGSTGAAATQGAGRGGRPGSGMGGPPPTVTVQAATRNPMDVVITALGTVTPLDSVVVHPRVDGLMQAVNFTEGQLVHAGDLLATIDPQPFNVALAQMVGQLERDKAQLAGAEADLKRYQDLLAQDSIASQQVDTQVALVQQLRGTVALDQAQVDNAKLQLSYTRVLAPSEGRVGLRQVDPGNMVHAADTNGIVLITREKPITVVFPVPQDQLPVVLDRLNHGARPPVDVYDRDGRKRLATGVLLTADNQVDTTTGTVKLKAQFPNLDGALFPNQFVNARLRVDTLPDALNIPTAAVQRGAPGLYVYALRDDSTVTVKPLKLGVTDGDRVQVLEGLGDNERVVTDGTDRLRDGGKVVVAQANAAGAGADAAAGHAHRQRPGAAAAPPAAAP